MTATETDSNTDAMPDFSPETSLRAIQALDLPELIEAAEAEGLEDARGRDRDGLVHEILMRRVERLGGVWGHGVLEILPDGFGFLRSVENSFTPSYDDIYVSPTQVRRFGLRTGHEILGPVRPANPGEKYAALARIDEVGGRDPEELSARTPFEGLTPVYPSERLLLEHHEGTTEMRVMDLLTPVGMGQRGLITSPPRAGKTILLKQLGQAILHNHPDVHLIVLLVDERPEEVTDMVRSLGGEIISSCFDEAGRRHIQVADLVLERAKRLVESGRDVVILLDSITRLARANNSETPHSGKILSGGLDAGALLRPKRFFGSARNTEEAGSLTIIGTALVETGSRMDEVIFEEFKGTGNMELVLDRQLADRRLFPAIDIALSGTRKEDLLYTPEELAVVTDLHRLLTSISDPVEALETLLKKIDKTGSNAELLLDLHND